MPGQLRGEDRPRARRELLDLRRRGGLAAQEYRTERCDSMPELGIETAQFAASLLSRGQGGIREINGGLGDQRGDACFVLKCTTEV